MDINQYISRAKYKSLPAGFNHEWGADYNSSWDYVVSKFSTYHFDKYKAESEGEWYHCLGRFDGDWSDEVNGIVNHTKQLTWDDMTNQGLRPFTNGVAPMVAQEDEDRRRHGLEYIDHANIVLEKDIDNFPKVKKMVDMWGLEKVTYRCQIQLPGNFFAPHIDKLWHRCPENPPRIVRILVQLADYDPGMSITFGNSVVTGWKAGDIFTFDHFNLPHATANISTQPRPMMVITGLRTPATDAVLALANKDSRYKV
jgi:hypothetical protein